MNTYKHLGDFSAVDPVYSRLMCCHNCEVEWVGCWDNFQCPKCGEGELPTYNNIDILDDFNMNIPKQKQK